ncbi:MAG: hypothetical protein Q4Q31_08060 [Bacillota bacterium]|nr:hypothetical protein [Bacillota bacterium]
MKFKYKSLRTYLVEEKKFIQLLEDMSLNGWQLDEIKYNFLKFKKVFPQRRKYQVFYKQNACELKEAGYHLICTCYDLQVCYADNLFIQNTFSNEPREKVLKGIYLLRNSIAWMIIAGILLLTYFPFSKGIPTFNYFIFYLGRYLFNGMIFFAGAFLFSYSLYNLYLGKCLENYHRSVEKILYVFKMLLLGLAVFVASFYILQIGLMATFVFIVSMILSWIVSYFSENNLKNNAIRYICVIVSIALTFINTSAPIYDNVQCYQEPKGYVMEDGGAFYKGLNVENKQGIIEAVYESSSSFHAKHLYQYQVERVYKKHFKEVKPYQEVKKKFMKIDQGMKYKNEYILLINKRVIYIQNIHTQDLEMIINHYKTLKI